jgi:MerR-like DNA binding protein
LPALAAEMRGYVGSERLLKIGEVARRTGTSLRTVRYYEELNLIQPKARIARYPQMKRAIE